MALNLKKKVGPLPVWTWALLVAVIVGWWYYRRRSNSGTNAGAVGSGQSSFVEPVSANAGQVNAAQSGQPSTASAPADSLSPDVLTALLGQQSDLVSALVQSQANAFTAGGGLYGTSTGLPYSSTGGGGIPDTGQAQAQPQPTVSAPVPKTAAKTPAPQPFGGVTSTKRLANGATLTTYANGRQVEKAPGKTAYVVKKGG